jgi:hypothetical protein
VLEKACRDADDLIAEDEGSRKIGVAFCNIHFTDTEDAFVENRLRNLLEEIKTICCDAVAWCFPELGEYCKDCGKTHLGVVLLVKLVESEGI